MPKAKTNVDGPYYVIAQIGKPIRETDEYVEINTIVMAERATEQEAEWERDRRSALNDGRWYFVMRADEHEDAA
jgi:hypothetical protein